MVYIVTDDSGYVKIGVAKQFKPRLVTLQTGNPRLIRPLATFETDSLSNDKKLEKILHDNFSDRRIILKNGFVSEWFDDSVLNDVLICPNAFLKHLREKYGFCFEVKRYDGDKIREIEDRRVKKLKSTITSCDVYRTKETKQDVSEPQQEKTSSEARFKVGDVVKTIPFLNVGEQYGCFFFTGRMATERSTIESVHEWERGFYYKLYNGMCYSEEMLEPYRQRINGSQVMT